MPLEILLGLSEAKRRLADYMATVTIGGVAYDPLTFSRLLNDLVQAVRHENPPF